MGTTNLNRLKVVLVEQNKTGKWLAEQLGKFTCSKMTDRKILLIALVVAIVLLMAYVICFWGMEISDNTTDWGAFGNYLAVCLSVLSISLIYITYREQRKANDIARAEHHIVTMLKTLDVLYEKNLSRIESTSNSICEHFKEPFYDLSELEYEKIINVCTFYYSSALEGKVDAKKLNYFFQYLRLCIDNIIHNKTLPKEQKKLQMTELSITLMEDARLLFFFWLLINARSELDSYYKYGLFIEDSESSPLLQDIVSYICSRKCPAKRQTQVINADDIILEDFPNEQFHDTYNRLFNKSKTRGI